MYSLFLIDGFYCVAKEINNAWVVRLKTNSKLEAELFKVRLNRRYIQTLSALSPLKDYTAEPKGDSGIRLIKKGYSGMVGGANPTEQDIDKRMAEIKVVMEERFQFYRQFLTKKHKGWKLWKTQQ